jgi:hypothetical protein
MHELPASYFNVEQAENQIKVPVSNVFCILYKQQTQFIVYVSREMEGYTWMRIVNMEHIDCVFISTCSFVMPLSHVSIAGCQFC